jgi:hypothetical protein
LTPGRNSKLGDLNDLRRVARGKINLSSAQTLAKRRRRCIWLAVADLHALFGFCGNENFQSKNEGELP